MSAPTATNTIVGKIAPQSGASTEQTSREDIAALTSTRVGPAATA
jgi:hypothetical protein